MILLDWTRMARSYCLAGVTAEGETYRVVRPLLAKYRDSPPANVGWSAYLLDGHARWEVFRLMGPERAAHPPPHVEDVWVRGISPRRSMATVEQRRAILTVTKPRADETLFGAPLLTTPGAAYLSGGAGTRSLTTLWVPAEQVVFRASRRGPGEPAEFRVRLGVAGLGDRLLSVKDHTLLSRAEQAGPDLDSQLLAIRQMVGRMGNPVVVRLGLSRPFLDGKHSEAGRCWLMADGFFSLSDPQP
jgi:hypothetical protein